MKLKDLVGQNFGKLTVIARENNKWRCSCACGGTTLLVTCLLRSGNTGSCGKCPRRGRSRRTVGHHLRKAHWNTCTSWMAMVDRCLREKNIEYHRYGGSGVTVCERWLDFAVFLEDMGDRPPGMTLDRFPDREGNYEPGNCRWATPHEQGVNRGTTRLTEAGVLEIHGRHEHGERNSSIARKMGLSRSYVGAILKGKKWRNLAYA